MSASHQPTRPPFNLKISEYQTPPEPHNNSGSDKDVHRNVKDFLLNGMDKAIDGMKNIFLHAGAMANTVVDDTNFDNDALTYHVTQLNKENTMELVFDPLDVTFDINTTMVVPDKKATVRDVIKTNPRASKRVERMLLDLENRTGIPVRAKVTLLDTQGNHIEPSAKHISQSGYRSLLAQNQQENQHRFNARIAQPNAQKETPQTNTMPPAPFNPNAGLANIASGHYNPFDPYGTYGQRGTSILNPYPNRNLIQEDLNSIQRNLAHAAQPKQWTQSPPQVQGHSLSSIANPMDPYSLQTIQATTQRIQAQNRVLQKQLNQMRQVQKPSQNILYRLSNYNQAEAAEQKPNTKYWNNFEAELETKMQKQRSEYARLTHNGTLRDMFTVHLKAKNLARQIYKEHIIKELALNPKPLTWYDLAKITDKTAHISSNDTEFRIIMWTLFGAQNSPLLTKYIDSRNLGLKQKYHNTGYQVEQFHHYLGGVTGDFYESHRKNNILGIIITEIGDDTFLNPGDIKLFLDTQGHRDDFLNGEKNNTGRFTVAPNIKKLLKPNIH